MCAVTRTATAPAAPATRPTIRPPIGPLTGAIAVTRAGVAGNGAYAASRPGFGAERAGLDQRPRHGSRAALPATSVDPSAVASITDLSRQWTYRGAAATLG